MIIETHGLTKRFGRHEAVHDLSLCLAAGTATALVGANGAGKTTTLRLLMNLIPPDSGTAKVLGADSRSLSVPQYERIGYVSENAKLPEGLTVGRFFDYLRPLYPAWDHDLEANLRTQFDLPAKRKLSKLSHGMKMKAQLSGALAYRPSLLVLDEPLSGLDPLVRDEVMEGLLENAAETTILISSHELAEIEGLATHVAFIDKGRLLFHEPIESLNDRFRDVTIGFVEEPDRKKTPTPSDWLSPKWNGRTVRFTVANYAGDDALRRSVPAAFGPLAHLSAEPMSLRDASKALIRAHRKDAA